MIIENHNSYPYFWLGHEYGQRYQVDGELTVSFGQTQIYILPLCIVHAPDERQSAIDMIMGVELGDSPIHSIIWTSMADGEGNQRTWRAFHAAHETGVQDLGVEHYKFDEDAPMELTGGMVIEVGSAKLGF